LIAIEFEDRIALSALLANEANNRPRRFRHFIYLPSQEKAAALATRLRSDGFDAESRMGADGAKWLVLAWHLLVADEDAIEQLRKRLSALAEALDGEYDGWEAEVL
jgi:regulator of RNase E activity RraB